MPQLKIFICKFFTVNRFTSSTYLRYPKRKYAIFEMNIKTLGNSRDKYTIKRPWQKSFNVELEINIRFSFITLIRQMLTVMVSKISSLTHETRNYTMETAIRKPDETIFKKIKILFHKKKTWKILLRELKFLI